MTAGHTEHKRACRTINACILHTYCSAKYMLRECAHYTSYKPTGKLFLYANAYKNNFPVHGCRHMSQKAQVVSCMQACETYLCFLARTACSFMQIGCCTVLRRIRLFLKVLHDFPALLYFHLS